MNILDENIIAGEREKLRAWRIHFVRIGAEVGRRGTGFPNLFGSPGQVLKMPERVRDSSGSGTAWRWIPRLVWVPSSDAEDARTSSGLLGQETLKGKSARIGATPVLGPKSL